MSSFFGAFWIQLLFAYANDYWKQVTYPGSQHLLLNVLFGLTRSKQGLIAENALLRQQLIILERQTKTVNINATERGLLVFWASLVAKWQTALLIVKPATLKKWHQQGFRLWWRKKAQAKQKKPRIAADTIALIQQMAQENRLWGAERIRGELLKLDIHVSKRTVQKYMKAAHGDNPQRQANQNWKTFVANHADTIWACDFVQTYDLFFRTIFIFFIIEIGSRRVVHCNVTRHPTDKWVSQQLREATPYNSSPHFLIRDNDKKYGKHFSKVAQGAQIEVLRTPILAPKANAYCERFIGSVRREFLDHIFILSEAQLRRLVREYVAYFNTARPHQGIQQRLPDPPPKAPDNAPAQAIEAHPILNGLHHDYRRIA